MILEELAPTDRKENMPAHIRRILQDPRAPQRVPENDERTQKIRGRAAEAAEDALAGTGFIEAAADKDAWWRTPLNIPGREVTKEEPLRVLVAGGGLAGLVTAAACHAKGMKVAIFEQASSYSPYGGPIQIQSNALRAIQRINPQVYEELLEAGTVTADRVAGLKIGYKKGIFMGLGDQYEKGDWLVRFDTLGPAMEAGLTPTVVVDRPVIQQIFIKHGMEAGTVRIHVPSPGQLHTRLGPRSAVRQRQVHRSERARGIWILGRSGVCNCDGWSWRLHADCRHEPDHDRHLLLPVRQRRY